jgi:hypothetical protein
VTASCLFSFNNLEFIDSLSFLQSSLDGAVNNLKSIWEGKDPTVRKEVFEHSVKEFENATPQGLPAVPFDDERFPLLLQKGVFPYEHMSGPAVFSEQSLPPIEAFHSSLTNDTISTEDYVHAQKVWEEFEIRDLGEYQDLYMALDVLLLAAVMQKTRSVCVTTYGLEPLKYVSAPALSADANLLMKPIQYDAKTKTYRPFMLELCPNTDQGRIIYDFCEKNKRGGITSVPGRYSKATDTKYTVDDKKCQDIVSINYFDATNLYGWAMSEPLPISDFVWWQAERVHDLIKDAKGDFGYTKLLLGMEGILVIPNYC